MDKTNETFIEEQNSYEMMTLAVKRVYEENPDKKDLIDAYVQKFKQIGEASCRKRKNRDKKVFASEWETLSKDVAKSEVFKRNLRNSSFTSSKILTERKRLLQEIIARDAKTVVLRGDSKVISNVLFDYKIGVGYVLAPELMPIFGQVDFAIKEFATDNAETLTLYRYCKQKNVYVNPEIFCGCSKKEALYGSTKYPGSTFGDYVTIGYFPDYRIDKVGNSYVCMEKGNIRSLVPGSFKAHNISTNEEIDDFRIVFRREKENGKSYVKKT